MKKISAVLAACVLAIACLGVVGCSSSSASGSASGQQSEGLANPVHEASESEVSQATGIDLKAPEGAKDVVYSYIDADGSNPIAQVTYKNEKGTEFTYRAQANSGTEATDISGMNYEWTGGGLCDVGYCTGAIQSCKDATVCTWFDVVPGIDYSLSVTGEIDPSEIADEANKVFISAQGDA